MAQAQSSPSISADATQDDMRTLTRADLAEALHRRGGFGRAEAAKYVEMVLDEIFEAIVARDDVKLSSFGAFQIRAKRERQGRNPKTGKGAKITARLVVSFKPSNVLRARVNGAATRELAPGDGKGDRKGDGAAHETGERSGVGPYGHPRHPLPSFAARAASAGSDTTQGR